ncbi:hypothetical protein LCGC14_1729610 [marine sediment metagenome]|uniref:Uncharacterized protein n=1 Tax=marine sediment metagenome TaxID=412755 RepID=A0A0F9JQK4_9ZZZZ
MSRTNLKSATEQPEWQPTQIWRHDPDRIQTLALTLILTVLAYLTVAIGVGVALGLALRPQRRNIPASESSEPEQ